MKASTRPRAAELRSQRGVQAESGLDIARVAPLLFAFLAVLGLGISTYLTATHFADKPIVCAGLGQCDYVNSSEYASVVGVPVSVLGILAYSGLLGTALLWALRPRSESLPIAYWGMALAGAGYAGYLTYVELDILHAICVWCVVSACVLTLSLLLATGYLIWGPGSEP